MRRPSSLPFVALLLVFLLLSACVDSPLAQDSYPVPKPTETSPASEPATSAPTELIIVAPWQPEGLAPGFTVVEEVEGTCFGGALTAARADAWRCSVERVNEAPTDSGLPAAYSQLFDPCLENPYDPTGPLACLSANGEVTLLRLTTPLPREYANAPDATTLPAVIVLDNGDECALATGATITVNVDGRPERVNYFCQSGGVVIGQPDTADVIWTIHFSADPRGLGDILTMGIARAYAFRGDTGNVGWSQPTDTAAPLRDVRLENFAGGQRLVFDFGDGPLPAYEVGYVNEAPVNEAGEPLNIAGDVWLRVWFAFPTTDAPLHTLDFDTIEVADANHFHGLGLTSAPAGNLMWLVGLDRVSGFEVRRDETAAEVVVDIFHPPSDESEEPVLDISSRGDAVRRLHDQLVAAGYLEATATPAEYGQTLREAVAAFQAAHDLIPDGVAGPAVWAALRQPLPPPREGTSTRDIGYAKRQLAQGESAEVSPASAWEVFVRGGPGLDYAPIGSLLPGQTAEVVGQIEGSSPIDSWWQVCCIEGQQGWVRADVVNVVGEPEPASDVTPPPAPTGDGIRPAGRPQYAADGSPILYFTFDDGPWATTGTIAATLEEHGGRGTFFAIGRQTAGTPAISGALVPAHSVQNHTYNHASLDGISRPDFFNEVEQTQFAIQQATGALPTCLRPPYGAMDGVTIQLAGELGLDIALWTIDTQDWRRPGVDAIVQEIMGNARPGAIILMHDGGGDRSQTVEALRLVLPQLRQQGYVFEALCG